MMRQLTFWQPGSPRRASSAFASASPADVGGFPGWADVGAAARWFSAQLQRPVALVWTQHGRTMVYFRHGPAGVRLRLHRVFLAAGAAEAEALVRYVRGEAGADLAVDRFVAQHAAGLVGARTDRLLVRGRAHDVGAIFEQLNSDYFHGGCTARITWGRPRRRPRPGAGQGRLSLFLLQRRLIVVHPCLDSVRVPGFYLAWRIYREMLHELFLWDAEAQPPRPRPAELAVLETCHPEHARCARWAAVHLEAALAAAEPPPRACGMRRLTAAIPAP